MKLEMFFEKFNQFADAPDAVAKMRELVFQLAVQGRLVQHDCTDEPAIVLLKRIRAARAALSSNRRSSVYTDAIGFDVKSAPFPAPPGWVWTSLGEVQVFTNGYAFKSDDYQSSGVGIIRMGELGENGEIDESNMKYVSHNIAQSLPSTFRVKPGDLLMGMSGSIGKLAINRSDKAYLLNQRVGRLEPILIEKAFLHVFLKTVEQHYLRISFGMAIKNLSTKQINETPFPLPPLAEQRRIVAKVDELMAICDRLEAQIKERETKHAALCRASLSRFAESPTPANLEFLFHKSFTITPTDLRKTILTLAVQGKLIPQDPNDEPADALLNRLRAEKLERIRQGTMRKLRSNEGSFLADTETPLPAGWASGCVADFGAPENNAIVDGPFGSNLKLSDYDPHGIYPVITISNIDEGFNLSTLRKVTEKKFQELKRSAVRANDILVAKIGSSYGKVGLYPDNMPVGIIPANLLKITPHPLMDWRFLVIALRSPDFKAALEPIVQFTAQPAFGVSKFKLLPISVPPLAEQRRIVNKVDQLMALVDQLETQLASSRATAANLMEAVVAELTHQ